jgi:hypothetical protein
VKTGRFILTERMQVKAKRNITTKSTKDTKGNEIVKFFVIFVCFEVGKYYDMVLIMD